MISNLRVRLTVFYGGIFVVFVAILLAVSYWLMVRHLGRTVDPFEAANALVAAAAAVRARAGRARRWSRARSAGGSRVAS